MICRLPDCNSKYFAGRLAIAIYLLFIGVHVLAQSSPSTVPPIHCETELDAIVVEISNNLQDPAPLRQRLEALENLCAHLPHISHNLGVLAAREENWPEAVAYLEKSLALDKRAAMTNQHLQQIFKYRAATAYARALNTTDDNTDTIEKPVFELQDSGVENADAHNRQPDTTQFHRISTIEYELFAWWQAIQSKQGVAEFYVADYSKQAIALAQRDYAGKQWTDFQREIAFTANDVVVILSNSNKQRSLILMRLVGTRWKIYQETEL